jgi:hypothetical protein
VPVEGLGTVDDFHVGGNRRREQRVRGVIDAGDVEQVNGFQLAKAINEAVLGLRHGGAVHGARVGDDNNRFTRLAGFVRLHTWRRHESQEIGFAINTFGEEAGLRGLALSQPLQCKIPVGWNMVFGKRNHMIDGMGLDDMLEALHLRRIKAGIQCHRNCSGSGGL